MALSHSTNELLHVPTPCGQLFQLSWWCPKCPAAPQQPRQGLAGPAQEGSKWLCELSTFATRPKELKCTEHERQRRLLPRKSVGRSANVKLMSWGMQRRLLR